MFGAGTALARFSLFFRERMLRTRLQPMRACAAARSLRGICLGNVVPRGNHRLPVIHENGRHMTLLVQRDNAPLAALCDDAVILHGGVFFFLLLHAAAASVAVVLIFQAAHEAPADARNLCRVEREVLLLCHADGDGNKVAEEGRTAERPPAASHAAHHLRLVAHADLTQLDARAEHARKLTNKLTKVYAPIRGEVKRHLREIERQLNVNEFHLEPELFDLLLADRTRFALTRPILIDARKIGCVGNTVHDAQIRRHGFIRHLARTRHHLAALHAARRLHDDMVALGDSQRSLAE